jgi:hypothetical protein
VGTILENPFSTRTAPRHAENSAEVEVIKCKAKVSGVYVWSGESYAVVGTLNDTEILADEEGSLTGTGTVNWLAQAYAEGCTSTDTMAPSQVDMRAHMDESGELVVQLDFEPVEDAVTLYCEQFGIVTADSNWTAEPLPEPLSLSVPAEGGVVTQAHGLVNTTRTETAPGNAVVIILPEPDEAGAFRQGQPAARAGLDAAWYLWRAAHQTWAALAH